jgi:hypothetical protein
MAEGRAAGLDAADRVGTAPGGIDRRPGVRVPFEHVRDGDMRPTRQAQLQRPARAGADDEQAFAVLRHAMIGGIDQVRGDGIAQAAQRVLPCGEQHPLFKGRDVLHQQDRAAVVFGASHHGPGRAAQRVVVRPFLASCRAVALAGGGRQHDVVRRHHAPVGLLEVLALVPGGRVVCLVVLHGERPVVGRPCDHHPGHAGTFGRATGPCKEVDGRHVGGHVLDHSAR